MKERYVLVFDICSSSIILEDLHRTNQTNKYIELIREINNFINAKENITKFKYEVYKFLGDGFIIIFDYDTIVENVLLFVIRLVDKCNKTIQKFIEDYVEVSVLRVGITAGLDKGSIIDCKLNNGRKEYIGQPFNVATRLQSSLLKSEHVNKCLITKKVYKEISLKELKIICSPTSRSLKNIAGNREIICYEFTPLFYRNADVSELRESKKDTIQKHISEKPWITQNFIEIYTTSTGAVEDINIERFTKTKFPEQPMPNNKTGIPNEKSE